MRDRVHLVAVGADEAALVRMAGSGTDLDATRSVGHVREANAGWVWVRCNRWTAAQIEKDALLGASGTGNLANP